VLGRHWSALVECPLNQLLTVYDPEAGIRNQQIDKGEQGHQFQSGLAVIGGKDAMASVPERLGDVGELAGVVVGYDDAPVIAMAGRVTC
jgi:hypothetical protein